MHSKLGHTEVSNLTIKSVCHKLWTNQWRPLYYFCKTEICVQCLCPSTYYVQHYWANPFSFKNYNKTNLCLPKAILIYRGSFIIEGYMYKTYIRHAIMDRIILTFSFSNNACFVSKCTSELRMAIASYIAQDFKNLRVIE